MKTFRFILLSISILLLGACTSIRESESQRLMIDTIKVVNASHSDVSDFRLEVPKNGGVVATNRILAGREFSNGVEPFPYLGNQVTLKWTQFGKEQSLDVFRIDELPSKKDVASVVILFKEQGGLDIFFEQ